MSSSRGRELQGPRPAPLKVSNTSSKIIKKSSSSSHPKNRSSNSSSKIDPVVIYLKSPKIIHVRPEQFMGLVQRLTGKDSTATADEVSYPSSPSSSGEMAADESMAKLKRDYNMFGGDQMKAFNSEVDFADQILEVSPTWLRFLTCV